MSNPDDDFASLLEEEWSKGTSRAGKRQLRRGQRVDGVVVAVTHDTIFVDVATRAEGRLERTPAQKAEDPPAVGERIQVTVLDPNPGGSPVLARSLSSADDDDTLRLAQETGTPVEGRITELIKGGLQVMVGQRTAFCPASHADLGYIKDLSSLLGRTLPFKVLEVRNGGRSIVLSRKSLLQEERKARATNLIETLKEGMELEGTVQSIQSYGVFVDLGGLQGMIHVSELAPGRVARPDEVVSVGETLRVRVLSVTGSESGNVEDTRISLSLKATQQSDRSSRDPDEILSGTVTKTEPFGVFVDTPAGQGLVPIGELELPPGSDPRRAYPVGKKVDVVIVSRDEAAGKLKLSINRVADAEAKRDFHSFKNETKKNQSKALGNLGDLLRDKVNLDRGRPRKA